MTEQGTKLKNRAPQVMSLEERFDALVAQWKREAGGSSVIAHKCMHPAYQQIIGMGGPAIPLILRELSRSLDHWFWALRSITGENPVPDNDRGNIRKMAEAWLEWGRTQGYLT